MHASTSGARCRHAQTSELCHRLLNHNFSLFVFAERDGVSPTNNPVEQSLHRAVIFRKLSSGSVAASGSKVLATTFSVIETCRRLGRYEQHYIRQSVNVHFHNTTATKLITQNAKTCPAGTATFPRSLPMTTIRF